ncbi:MAG: hypothetical protein SWN10_20155 [Pseudomonadota bacterium]|nr:hypothetical protein [Pseudomonadota bacterium]
MTSKPFVASEQTNPELQPDNLGDAMVNAKKSGAGVINWLITTPRSIANKEGAKRLLLAFITGVFYKNREKLGFSVKLKKTGKDESTEIMPEILMADDSGFELKVDSSLGENVLHPFTLEGAGEIKPENGHKPLLMLICLQERFRSEWPGADDSLVTLCDEQGNTVEYVNFSSLEPVIERMGFDYDAARADAVKLGLAEKQVDWSSIQSEIEDCYF